ncbi:MAG TPA: hypothetical protein VE961_00335 [Pyrinomonadaceae bacterium]|nr:hypothetical protein [Pyrinomonadaceae bacterium]
MAAVAGAVLVVLMVLFPPWDYFDDDTSGRQSAGYHFILTPPAPRRVKEVFPRERFPHLTRSRINDVRLILQLGTIIPIWLGLIAALHPRRSIWSIGLAVVLIASGLFVLGFAAYLVYLSYRNGRLELP